MSRCSSEEDCSHRREPVAAWDVEAVCAWAQENRIPEFAVLARSQDIDGPVLLTMQHSDFQTEPLAAALKEAGVSKFGQMRRLELALGKIRHRQEGSDRAAARAHAPSAGCDTPTSSTTEQHAGRGPSAPPVHLSGSSRLHAHHQGPPTPLPPASAASHRRTSLSRESSADMDPRVHDANRGGGDSPPHFSKARETICGGGYSSGGGGGGYSSGGGGGGYSSGGGGGGYVGSGKFFTAYGRPLESEQDFIRYAEELQRYQRDRQTGAWTAADAAQMRTQMRTQRPAPEVQYVQVPVSPPTQVQVQRPRPAPQVQYVQQPVQQQVQYVVAPQPVQQVQYVEEPYVQQPMMQYVEQPMMQYVEQPYVEQPMMQYVEQYVGQPMMQPVYQQPAQYAPGRSPLPMQAPPGYQYVATGQTPPPMQAPPGYQPL